LYFPESIIECLDKLKGKHRNRSEFYLDILKHAFKDEELLQRIRNENEKERGAKMNNQKVKNLDWIMTFMSEHKWIHLEALQNEIEVFCGVTNKKAIEYTTLLIHTNRILFNNRYVIDTDYAKKLQEEGKPLPGSDEWHKERMDKTLENLDKHIQEKKKVEPEPVDNDIVEILEADVTNKNHTHMHEQPTFECKVCSKQICAKCASQYEQFGIRFIGRCDMC